jgi:two-component system nitrate/nitrite response regulator NarL
MNGDHRDLSDETVRVLVADSSRIHTRLLADELRRDGTLSVLPSESDSTGLVAAVIEQNVDVLVISATLDEHPSHGIEVLREVRALRPDTKAVVLLDSSKDEAVVQAFRAGARAVFGRNDPIEMLSGCVRCVHQGQIWANSHHLSIAIGALANSPTVRAVNAEGMNLLSQRELQVVRFLAEGLTNREIAERMKLSQHTVKNYLFRVFDKLGVSSRVELLFMTLSHSPSEGIVLPPGKQKPGDNGYSRHEAELLKKSAEAGLPAAQLALAQLYLTRHSGPDDLVDAYMWYIVATERALQAREIVTKMLTPEQIDEAEQKASAWIAQRKQPAGSSTALSPRPKRSLSSPDETYSRAND